MGSEWIKHVKHLELSLALSICSIRISYNDGGDDGDNDYIDGDDGDVMVRMMMVVVMVMLFALLCVLHFPITDS